MIFIITIVLNRTGQELYSKVGVLSTVVLLFDTLRYAYYIYFGHWKMIHGLIISVDKPSKIKSQREVYIQENSQIYSFIIPKKNSSYQVGNEVILYISSRATPYEQDGVKHLNSVLSKKMLPRSRTYEEE